MPNLINLSNFIGAGSVDQVMLSLQRHTCSHTFFTAVIFSTLSFCFGPICLFTFRLWPICPAVFCWIYVLHIFFKFKFLAWFDCFPTSPLVLFHQHHMIHLICKLVKTEHAVVINTKCDCCFWPPAPFLHFLPFFLFTFSPFPRGCKCCGWQSTHNLGVAALFVPRANFLSPS